MMFRTGNFVFLQKNIPREKLLKKMKSVSFPRGKELYNERN